MQHGARRVLEVGGGANPALPLWFVREKELEYSILDILPDELAKAPPEYRKLQGDIADPQLDLPGGYELVFSRLLAEHICDTRQFHVNIHRLLVPGGYAFHFFPTLYAPPFVLNWLLPDRITEAIISIVQSGRERSGRNGKFPAYYHWCLGPVSAQIQRFTDVGYKVEQYIGFFGHGGYYVKLPRVKRWHDWLSAWLVRHPVPYLTSFAYIVLWKA